MVGGTPRHALIAANFLGEATQLLKGKPCIAYTGDLRIKVDSAGLYTYPDASLVLDSIGITIPLSELYRNVQFDPAEQAAVESR